MPRRSGRERLELLRSIDGIETRTAQTIIGEIGVDMTRFASAGHLASWAGRCPGNHESAGKRRSGLTRHGSTWLDDALKDAAMAAIRTNDRYLQAQIQRLRPRIGHGPRARRRQTLDPVRLLARPLSPASSTATAAAILQAPRLERQTRRLIAHLERLGLTVTLQKAA